MISAGSQKKTKYLDSGYYATWVKVMVALQPNFFDLLLVDINLPHMNGFQVCEKLLELDINVRVCFMSSGEINREALRDISSSKPRKFYQKTG
jgi:DNA-binding response OmpR family regulator